MNLPDSLDSTLNAVAEFIISPQFIWIWCFFIVAYGLKWYFHIQKESLALHRQLKRAIEILRHHGSKKEFALNFEQVRHQMTGISKLFYPWKEYTQSLLFSGAKSAPESDKKYEKVMATRDPQDFFNDDSLIHANLDSRHLSVIPTHLSSLGILGTFCGLSSGIFLARHGLSGGEMSEIQQSLARLLSGASLAFWTSITGILSSISFSRIEKKVNRSLRSRLSEFNSVLQDRVELISLEQLGNQQIRQSHAQISGLEKINSGIHELAKNKADLNEKVLKEIVDEFRKSLMSSCGQEIKFIAEAFKHIHLSLKETKDALGQSGHLMLETIQEGSNFFKKNLHEMSHQFQSGFNQTQEMIQKTLKSSASETQASLKSCLADMEKGISTPTLELGKSMSSLSRQLEISTRQWAQVSEQSHAYHQKVMESQNKLSQHINPLLGASHSIAEACQKAQEALGKSSEAAIRISDSVRTMESIQKSNQHSWEQYCKRFEGVDQSLHRAFTTTNASLNQYSEKIKGFTVELDKYMSKGILSLSGAVGDLHQVIGALPESLKHLNRQPTGTVSEGARIPESRQ